MLRLASLFFFTMASVGFVLFMLKYPRSSEVRIWGIRLSHTLGFMGVLMMRLHYNYFTEVSVLIISSLIVSMVAYELSVRYLR
ncbi:MAG: hypothetical protein ACRD1R_13970 [Acidobacteriota bacterium]